MRKTTELSYNFDYTRSIKCLKFFRGVLRIFSMKKFSSDAQILVTIDTDKYTFDEFLTFTGDFSVIKSPRKYWIKCLRNDIAVLYKEIERGKRALDFSKTYSNWDEDYFDNFRGLTFAERYAILKEI